MTVLSRGELRQLIDKPLETSVSLYMPTERTGDTRQNSTRLKNLLREAEGKLAEAGIAADEAEGLTKPLQNLLSDDVFWQHQADGFAAFSSRSMFRTYRLPLEVPQLVLVSQRFHIKPLVSFFSHDVLFYVLALSQNSVRLLQCTRDSVREVTPEALPRSLAEALRYDDPERQLQFHTGTGMGKGKRSAIFHGHAVGTDDKKENISRFLRQVDRGIRDVLREEQAPLVVAGVDYLNSLYRQANTYANLTGAALEGNFDDSSAQELQRQAWDRVIRPHLDEQLGQAVSRYYELGGTDLSTQDIKEIIVAAHDGRVAELFVATGTQVWGSYHAARRSVHLHKVREPDDEDLLDLAAAQTLLGRGTVYAMEPESVPNGGVAAAILRY